MAQRRAEAEAKMDPPQSSVLSPQSSSSLWALAREHEAGLVDFCRRLIRTPSMSGEEGALAEVVLAELARFGYDEARTDAVGNVIGLVRGTGQGPSLMFNTHLDHVDPGDPARWPFPPYAATLHEGEIWGRGACDIKGALATQVYAIGALKRAGLPLPGDVYVVGAVLEEVGGYGTARLVEELRPDYAILGEATSNTIARGHRGSAKLEVIVRGRSVHGSVPENGANPHYAVARLLLAIEELQAELPSDPFFGRSTVAPTRYLTDQVSSNVTPGECVVHLDWRSVPGEAIEDVLETVRGLLDRSLIPGTSGEVRLLQRELRTYTGLSATVPARFPPFGLPEDHELVAGARRVLEEALGRPVPVGKWSFATDGGHLMAAGIPTIGFAPAEERFAHTVEDRIPVAQMVEAFVGYAALALGLAAGGGGQRADSSGPGRR